MEPRSSGYIDVIVSIGDRDGSLLYVALPLILVKSDQGHDIAQEEYILHNYKDYSINT